MKPRILAYRFDASHDWISLLGSINNAVSLTDYEAFLHDPAHQNIEAFNGEALLRRQQEMQELIHKKGGMIVCTLRPNAHIAMVSGIGGMIPDRYSLIRSASPDVVDFVSARVRLGEGTQIRRLSSVRGVSSGYFDVLQGHLQFAAYLQCSDEEVSAKSGKVFAVNSVGYPIAVEFPVDEGVLCFVPMVQNVPADRIGAAILRMIRTHFEKHGDSEIPEWAARIEVPGAKVNDDQIEALTRSKGELDSEIKQLQKKRQDLMALVGLLHGYGKAVLERQVRTALRLLGFLVPEPEEYAGEWDVELTEPTSGRTAVGEVEGSEGVIDVSKYRQLLDYIEAESLEGRDHKGILVGNGFRLLSPETAERQQQFSDHALRGATRNSFCLLPTAELFKAVCAVLERPDDENLKIEIRDSIFGRVGVWTFARQVTPPTTSAISEQI